MDNVALVLIVFALLAGAALGWFLGTRESAGAKATTEALRLQLDGVAAERDAARQQAEEKGREATALAIAKAELERDTANHDRQITLMKEAREELLAQFRAAGGEVLGKAQEQFLQTAAERFGHTEKANKEALAAMLKPVDERLKSYEQQVQVLEQQRVNAFGQLHGVIEEMRKGQEAVRAEAQRLGNSLTHGPKARGRWGERALQNVLEQCGLSEHTDFNLEHSLETDEGRLRPDAIVHVPGQKKLVIDAKVSLNAYQAAFETDDEDTRRDQLKAHARSMRTHVQQLGAKAYQSQFEEAPDYVVMFVPGEHFVAAALEADPELWDFAFKNGVLLATPTNLVAIARTVAQVWRQDRMAVEAKEVGRMGSELYERLRTASEHLRGMGAGLDRAVRKYNDFVGSFERNVLTSGRRMAEKGLEISKEIEEVPLVEGAPRYTADDPEEPVQPRLVDIGKEGQTRSAG